jgi:hypothetical protein
MGKSKFLLFSVLLAAIPFSGCNGTTNVSEGLTSSPGAGTTSPSAPVVSENPSTPSSSPTTSVTALAPGIWGGAGIELSVTASGATVTIPCGGGGAINGSIVLDANGRFNVLGTVGWGTQPAGVVSSSGAECSFEDGVTSYQGILTGSSLELWTAGPALWNCDLSNPVTVIQPAAFGVPAESKPYSLQFGAAATGMNELCPL